MIKVSPNNQFVNPKWKSILQTMPTNLWGGHDYVMQFQHPQFPPIDVQISIGYEVTFIFRKPHLSKTQLESY